jgi:hypothetical protein
LLLVGNTTHIEEETISNNLRHPNDTFPEDHGVDDEDEEEEYDDDDYDVEGGGMIQYVIIRFFYT